MGSIYLLIFMLSLTGYNSLSQNYYKSVKNHPIVNSTLKRLPETRVINGYLAGHKQFPFQAILIFLTPKGERWCGGALISKRYVLSAAHCFQNLLPNEKFAVVLGAWDVRKNESYRVELLTTDYVRHEGWNPQTLVNDLMVVKLPSEVKETDYIKVIPITRDVRKDYVGVTGVTSGWGRIRNTSTPFYYRSKIISNKECARTYGRVIRDVHICLSSTGNAGIYDGDSGNGLVVDKYTLVGIASFSGKPGDPSVFARLTKYLDWIAKHTDVLI